MNQVLRQALSAGSGRLLAWSDVLDDINVFPVADGDTGRNLVLSLSPLRDSGQGEDGLVERLLMEARGNSGNIAARFLSGLLEKADDGKLLDGVQLGRLRAWQAVAKPKPGTMLSLFDGLAEGLECLGEADDDLDAAGTWADELLQRLEDNVAASRDLLPELRRAGVVDAGALGMYLFFDGFLSTWVGHEEKMRSVVERFGDSLRLDAGYRVTEDQGHCVDLVMKAAESEAADWTDLGESVVTLREGDLLKVHLHTDDIQGLKQRIEGMGDLLRFRSDDLHAQTQAFEASSTRKDIHLITDAAGSVTRDDAHRLGFSLLNSYVLVGDRAVPETYLAPNELYSAMARGLPVSTSQASDFERGQHLHKALEMYERVIYLCVGSAYTGNHEAARRFKRDHDPDDRLLVIDSQAASGRLGLMALELARRMKGGEEVDAVIEQAGGLRDRCVELIFLDQLKFLAAGGRLSKTSAFFGDLLKIKPVVSPLAEGAKKIGSLKRRDEQLPFALEQLGAQYEETRPGKMLLQYSDNMKRVEQALAPGFEKVFKGVTIQIQPLSLTSGAHMGPGAWAVAYLPGGKEES